MTTMKVHKPYLNLPPVKIGNDLWHYICINNINVVQVSAFYNTYSFVNVTVRFLDIWLY